VLHEFVPVEPLPSDGDVQVTGMERTGIDGDARHCLLCASYEPGLAGSDYLTEPQWVHG
jgi:hypothetical protein